jgi:hypothetical protein
MTLAALLGSVMFITKVFVPPPIDRLLIVVDAVILALGALFIKRGGATIVSAVGGALTGLWRPAFLPFSLIFLILYGGLTDLFFAVFKVDASAEGVERKRLMAVMTLSTLLIAVLTYNVTAFTTGIIPKNDVFDVGVMLMGPVSGVVAGYAAAYLWNKYLKNINA